MLVNRDPEVAALKAKVREAERLLLLATATIERGPEITMGDRERILEQLREYRL